MKVVWDAISEAIPLHMYSKSYATHNDARNSYTRDFTVNP